MIPVKAPKKLIEVAMPLDDINVASAREKSIRHGHPSTLHLWWARRPLAAARAVLFAQLVNDPGYERHLGRGVNKKEAAKERERLFGIIRRLVLWENTNNEEVLREARDEIWKSWRETCHLNRDHPRAAQLFDPEKLPAFHDPFAGGGTIPLEAQRLGLEAHASDLNPVAVLINKAMIEIPPKFAGRAPVGPLAKGGKQREMLESWKGAAGLAEDVRRYGQWMRDEAEKRIGHLYPKVEITKEMAEERPDLKPLVGQKLTVIAWLWARTVKSPNPAYAHVDVPLASTFMLSTKEGSEAWVEPVVEGDGYCFKVHVGEPRDLRDTQSGTKLAHGANFRCLVSGTPIEPRFIKAQGVAGRMGSRVLAIIAESPAGRVWLSPTQELTRIPTNDRAWWKPDLQISGTTQYLGVQPYGSLSFSDLFSSRQLAALNTFSDLIQDVHGLVRQDARAAGYLDDQVALDRGGCGATAYAEAVTVYLACAISRASDYWNMGATWEPTGGFIGHLFTKQAIPMVWDFAEGNPFSDGTGNWSDTAVAWIVRVLNEFQGTRPGYARQADAAEQYISSDKVVSTDPPYYDNIPYADLSDYFYVWLRRALRSTFPDLFATMAVPKSQELVAFAYRHEDKKSAEQFFLAGMTRAMTCLAEQSHAAFPNTIYYAFKQSDSSESGTASTGWEAFLDACLQAGFSITGTWPVRTERSNRSRGIDSNALASSIVLVCRRRQAEAPTISRRDFVRELNTALPEALDEMTRGADHSPVAPVDLSQAIIGPGMAIFSKYSAVLEADGTPMSVRTALQLINRFLAEDDFDHDTQFCLHWLDGNGWNPGKFGDADVLARAKGTSVAGVAASGTLESGGGKVRLFRYAEYPDDWSPEHDSRTPVWEALHHLIRALQTGGGESAAGTLVRQMPGRLEAIRQLAYRLYTLCERRGWAEDARAYNELITSWSAIEAAGASREDGARQTELTL